MRLENGLNLVIILQQYSNTYAKMFLLLKQQHLKKIFR